jgi:23S rRNA (adenine2503-C2)-methyltransferase
MRDIREISSVELEEYMAGLGEKKFRVKQVEEWLWKKGVSTFGEMTNLSLDLRKRLKSNFTLSRLTVHTLQVSRDGTHKFGFITRDDRMVEGVIIPANRRLTACISSQIGCKLNCKFCATASLKRGRDLTGPEIFDQVFLMEDKARELSGSRLNNIVFMGMGEPLLNYDNVVSAIGKITSAHGLEYSPQRITLSTAGLVKEIIRLADDDVPFNLAISLHTADEEKRSHLMPVNRSNPLIELRDAIRYFYEKTGTRITYEYLLLKDFNDSLDDARAFAEFCKISPCKINLIEYNEIKTGLFFRSDAAVTQQFMEFLKARNLVVHLRKSRGADIDAACGQLAGKVKSDE